MISLRVRKEYIDKYNINLLWIKIVIENFTIKLKYDGREICLFCFVDIVYKNRLVKISKSTFTSLYLVFKQYLIVFIVFRQATHTGIIKVCELKVNNLVPKGIQVST